MKVSSSLYKLNPILDNGLLRVHGRLNQHPEIEFDSKCPIILPKRSHIAMLIVKYYHDKVCNHVGGSQYLLSRVREKYWPIQGHALCKDIIHSCSECNIRKPCPIQQKMATLPNFRIPEKGEKVTSYVHTGVDYGGPFLTQQGRGKSRTKRWLALFTCMQYMSVHLEVVHSLDTQSFLMAFHRFVSSNCRPSYVYLDDMRTFLKGEESIDRWIKSDNTLEIDLSSSYPNIQFTFIPPSSPNFGGAWESMIKLAKRGLYDVIRPGIINDEQLMTAFKLVEGLINSRPLTKVSTDPNDERVLTPAHFIVREAYSDLAPLPNDWSFKERYAFLQDLLNKYWKRFMAEVVPLKNSYQKQLKESNPYKIGDLVVLTEDLDRNRGKRWPVARIISMETSHDDLNRTATLWFNGKSYKRSFKSFAPLFRKELNW